jgi:hypothetical protein
MRWSAVVGEFVQDESSEGEREVCSLSCPSCVGREKEKKEEKWVVEDSQVGVQEGGVEFL